MRVIGIDPAPSKNTVIYLGEGDFVSKHPTELKNYIDDEKAKSDVLLCWDAPLTTGKLTPGENDKKNKDYSEFNWRKFEYIVNYTKDMDWNIPPKGISTMGYAGCSHWVLTQYCLGLPTVYEKWNKNDLPFVLITTPTRPNNGSNIVEVHPALALWCLLSDKYKNEQEWIYKNDKDEKIWPYKKDKSCLKDSMAIIKELAKKHGITCPDIESDDHLDAYIAWLLGRMWLDKKDDVILVGNGNTGAILLPNTEWSRSLAEELKK